MLCTLLSTVLDSCVHACAVCALVAFLGTLIFF